MDIRIKQRLLKDVRSAAAGRQTSAERLARARKQGHKIPSLEEAMVNVRLAEKEDRIKKEGKGEAHGGQAGPIGTKKERRVEKRNETKKEKVAGLEAEKTKVAGLEAEKTKVNSLS